MLLDIAVLSGWCRTRRPSHGPLCPRDHADVIYRTPDMRACYGAGANTAGSINRWILADTPSRIACKTTQINETPGR
jgi:hypothetical protein